ncbi:peptidase M14 [Russula earlei]|uniref:Peptidase M14 n=1 Tax=Russula earlei TaxID=71964 RepID=A0ACC0UKI6_9AGAM|nr:peptidase M14 [Russula earlei]
MFLSLLFVLAFTLFSRAAPFDHDNGGILYRFSPTSTNETEGLLSWAELREWDLWQMNHSHIDVYFPRRAIAEAELGLLPFPLPASTSHRIMIDREGMETGTSTSCERSHNRHDDDPAKRKHATLPIAAAAGTRTSWDVRSLSNATFHERYHTLDEIESFARDLAAAYPRQLSIVPLGHSGEGREMFALEIVADAADAPAGGGAPSSTSSDGLDHENERSHDPNLQVVLGGKRKDRTSPPVTRCGFLVTGAQHAREWVASASALYVAHALLADRSEAYSLARLLERHSFYIVPVPNPDGYVYTWERDRFWYKNRLQLGPDARCVGVDMNRNWGYKWKRAPRPEDPCSYWYPGTRPFQAPEVNNMDNYFSRLPRLKGFLDLRSYGQMLSTPFSYSCKRSPKDAEDQLEAISGAAHAIKKSHGTLFTTGALCSTLYRASGNIVDWLYKKMGVKYSFAAHLRDTGTYGYALPEQWIRPVGEETAKMIEYIANFIADKECR